MTKLRILLIAAVIYVVSAATTPVGASERSITATVSGSGPRATVLIDDSHAHGSNLTKVVYYLRDGYAKAVIIPSPGAKVYGEDIAICGDLGAVYYDIQFIGPGVGCKPVLHSSEVFYHQNTGDLVGSFIPPRNLRITETATGSGHYLTVGHRDHGSMLKVEYYWANGEELVVKLPANALVSHITLITSNPTPTLYATESLSINP